MKRSVLIVAAVGLVSALVACSSTDGKGPTDCSETPKAKGCTKVAPPASTQETQASPVAQTPPPAIVPQSDAGSDAARPHKPDGGATVLPEANVACTDLLRCCSRVRDTIERAACYGIGYKSSASSCANAIIAYQVFGGCSHSPFEMPDIFNSDGTENQSKSCEYLLNQCNSGGDCSGYDNQCGTWGTGGGGGGGYEPPVDPCEGKSPYPNAQGGNEYDCCIFNDYETCAGVSDWGMFP